MTSSDKSYKTVTAEEVVRDLFADWFTPEKQAEEDPLVYKVVVRRLTMHTQEALDTLVEKGKAVKSGDKYTIPQYPRLPYLIPKNGLDL